MTQELSQNERLHIALIILWLKDAPENTAANARLTMESYDSPSAAVSDASYFCFGLPRRCVPVYDRPSLIKAFEYIREHFADFFPE